MGNINLTVTSEGGQPVSSVTTGFDTTRMIKPKASGSGCAFGYPNEKGVYEVVVVSESKTAVDELMEAASTSTGNRKKLKLRFDATGGKAIGTYSLVDADTGAAVTLPSGARITRSWYENLTTFTSATDAATIALSIATDDAAGLKAAVAISNGANAWDAGLVEGIQTGTAANFSEKATADRAIQAVVAVEDLTAGELVLVCEYEVIGS